jgi:hypothetical protein
MNATLPSLARLSLAGAALLLTQCSMPPRDAWRIVQNEGLIPYLTGTYTYQPGMYLYGDQQPAGTQSRYLATAAPLQHTVATAPVVPYRPDAGPVPNPYLAGSYYEPQPAPVAERPRPRPTPAPAPRRKSESSSRSSGGSSTASSLDGPTPPPTLNKTPGSEPKSANKTAEAKDKPSAPPAKLATDELPYGTPVSGRPGMVNSPFATKDQLVDVTGMSVGETVKCPYSGKLFRVPPTQSAAAPKSSASEAPAPAPEPKAAPSPETPADKPKTE